jgi:hypothetical protein
MSHTKQTAMQQLLTQMREERSKLPIPIEWGRCYQAIEMMIHHTYLQMEREQIEDAYVECYMNHVGNGESILREANSYYKNTYGGQDEK